MLEPRQVPAHHRGHLGIGGGILDRAVDQQAALPALRAQQVPNQPVEVRPDLRDRRPWLLQVAQLRRHHELGVPVQGSHQQSVLAARERSIQTARLHPGRPDQVVH